MNTESPENVDREPAAEYISASPVIIPPEAGGIDRNDAPWVIFLHGRGLGPESVSEISRAFPTARLIAPTGGITLRRGHTWFLNERIGVARPGSLDAAVTRLVQWLDTQGAQPRRVLLCGFSNGGALAASLLLRYPDRFIGGALLSAPLVLPPWPPGGLAAKPIFYAYGYDQDTVVPSALYDSAVAYLRDRSGANLTIRCYSMGHVISDEEVSDLTSWFASACSTNV
jgi:phospholipase/carboxylesterase